MNSTPHLKKVRERGFNSGNGSADTPQRRVVVLVVVVLVPVAEALSPRIVVVVLRGRPVPTGGIRTTSVSMAISWSGQTMFIRPAFSLSASALVSALFKGGQIPPPSEMNMLAGSGLDLNPFCLPLSRTP